MPPLDFFKLSQDFSIKRRLLLERVERILSACRRREECLVKLAKLLVEFVEKNPEENLRIALSITGSIPSEYSDRIVKLMEALSSEKRGSGLVSLGGDVIEKLLRGRVTCSDLDELVLSSKELKDFLVVALTLALLEKASEMKGCEKDFARSLLALVRMLCERGHGELALSILNKYSVRIRVHKSGGELRGISVSVGNNITIDLTEVTSLVYPDISVIISVIMESGSRSSAGSIS